MNERPTPSVAAEDQVSGGWTLVKILATLSVATCVFVVLWAVLNFGWGTMLDKLITPAVFAEPCRRLATSDATLTRYAPRETSRRGRLLRLARCHFGGQAVIVYEAAWTREFEAREFWLLLVVNGLVLMTNIVAALFCAFHLILLLQKGLDALARRRSIHKQLR